MNAYFASYKIQCLLCGRWFHWIAGPHLTKIHGITIDEYKEMYGLPWSRGLNGEICHEKKIENAKRLYEQKMIGAGLKPSGRGIRRPKRTVQPFRRDMIPKRTNGKPAQKYWRKDFEAVLERMRKQQRLLNDVCRDPDMPSKNTWTLFVKKHPEFNENACRIHNSLPYSVQVKGNNLSVSPQFILDCQRMRSEGVLLRKIADALGVSMTTVALVLRDNPVEEASELSVWRKWKWEDYEAVLDRMRTQQRNVQDVCKDPDTPDFISWKGFVKNHPELKEKAREIHWRFPYSLQIRAFDVSPRFRIDCERMRDQGMSLTKIMRALGVGKDSVDRILQEYHKKPRSTHPGFYVRYDRKDFEALLDRMRKQQRSLYDVIKDPDLPPFYSMQRFAEKHPEFREKTREIHFRLPYSLQIKTKDVSPRFRMDCERLRDAGKSAEKIGRALGVTSAMVRRALKTFYAKPGVTRSALLTTFHREAYEAILERMRTQNRTIGEVCEDPDLPSYPSWNNYRKKHPELQEKYRQVLSSLPYHVQLRGRVIPPGFFKDCQKLRSRGMTIKEIAVELGVKKNSVVRMFQKSVQIKMQKDKN